MGRTKLQKQRDKRRVSQMYLQGDIQADIAASCGLSQPTVSRILTQLQAEWQAAAVADIDTAKARELAKIDALELEYWAAWKRSCEDAETETTKQSASGKRFDDQGNPLPDKAEKLSRREGQSGDPRYLAGVQWCINKRCEIVGVNAPVKQETNGTQRVVVEYVNQHSVTDAARKAVASKT